jgi:hypothetical protein
MIEVRRVAEGDPLDFEVVVRERRGLAVGETGLVPRLAA